MTEIPNEIVELIIEHASALCIQQAFRRKFCAHIYFGHAKNPLWFAFKHELEMLDKDAWRLLIACPLVRREWRTELGSWMGMPNTVLKKIVFEASQGLWGRKHRF